MTRKPALRAVLIGNGLFAQVSRRESLFEADRRIQRTCKQRAQRRARDLLHMRASPAAGGGQWLR